MQLQPYLFFDGRCEEAIKFYTSALGAKVEMLMRYKDSPDPKMRPPNASNDNVMHACLRIGDTAVMASDGECKGKAAFNGFSLSITAKDEKHAEKLFASLAEGGQVHMPLTKTFFASRFGTVADRFGVPWMVIAEPRQGAAKS